MFDYIPRVHAIIKSNVKNSQFGIALRNRNFNTNSF